MNNNNIGNLLPAVDDAEEECEDALLDRPAVRLAIILAYLGVFLLCLIGNLFTILVICAHRSMRTATNFFLANLALADLLVAIFCILQNMLHLVGTQDGHWILGGTLCKLYAFMLHLVPCTGIGILVCVSVEKYIAVLHPLLALKVLTPRFRCALMASIWAVSVLFNLPYYTSAKHIVYPRLGIAVCTRSTLSGLISTRNMVTLSFVLWYCIPLATIAFLYTRIGLVLWRSVPLKKLTQASAFRTNSNETMTLVTNAGSDSYRAAKRSVVAETQQKASVTGVCSNPPSLNPTPLASELTQRVQRNAAAARRSAVTLMSEAGDEDDEEEDPDVEDHAEEEVEAQPRSRVPTASLSARLSNGGLQTHSSKNGAGNGGASAPTGTILVSTMESRKKVIRLLIAIVCSFAILTLPHHARLFYTVWTVHPLCNGGMEALVQPGTYLLLFLSSSCNPFLYAFMSQRFRSAIRDIFKCRRGRARRRRSTRTRTQNSDIVACTTGAGGGGTAGAPAPEGVALLNRHSSLTRLNLASALAVTHHQATHQLMHNGCASATNLLSGSERNLLMLAAARHRNGGATADNNGCGNHLRVQPMMSREKKPSGGSASAGSGSTASSMVYATQHSNNGNAGMQMAVVYRKGNGNGGGQQRA